MVQTHAWDRAAFLGRGKSAGEAFGSSPKPCHGKGVPRTRPSLALVTLLLLFPGCQVCTDIGCGPAVEITVGSEMDPLEPSAETINVDLNLDGDRFRLTCSRSEAECEARRDEFSFSVSGTRFSDRLEIEIFGGDELAPERIEVYVEADGSRLAEATLSPQYRDARVNGEGCEACRSAEQPIVLPTS